MVSNSMERFDLRTSFWMSVKFDNFYFDERIVSTASTFKDQVRLNSTIKRVTRHLEQFLICVNFSTCMIKYYELISGVVKLFYFSSFFNRNRSKQFVSAVL